MAPEVPTAWDDSTWTKSEGAGAPGLWSYAFNDTLPTGGNTRTDNNVYSLGGGSILAGQFSQFVHSEAPIAGIVQGCNATCRASIQAPALAVKVCTSHQIPVNYSNAQPSPSYGKLEGFAPPISQQIFSVSVGLMLNEQEQIYLVTQHYRSYEGEDCVGTLLRNACTLESAIGEYEIPISDDKATINDPGQPKIIALANNTRTNYSFDAHLGGHPSTLAGIVNEAFFLWDSLSSIYRTDSGSMQILAVGTASSGYGTGGTQQCPPFLDPLEDVMRGLNMMMVYGRSFLALL
jgi:hypothetical protein